MSTLNPSKNENKKLLLSSNPVLTRLKKVKPDAAVSDVATYSGIMTKTLYFLVITLAGIIAYALLNQNIFSHGDLVLNLADDGETVSQVVFSVSEIISAIAAGIFTIVLPFVCAFSVAATPVCGTLYCLSEGYMISMIIFKFLGMRNIPTSIGLVALLLTVLVVGVMGFLYAKRIVKVGAKFYAVLFSVCGAMILGALISLVLSLIPATRGLISSFMNNPVIGICCSLLAVILAATFLLSDFAVIESTVENHLPARYEWMASFGLAFTVLWLYLKILDLLIRILGKNSD